MSDAFNLTGLFPLFTEAIEREEKTLAFEVENGKGRFLLLMFFDDEDTETYDQLFVYLRNTRYMLNLKLYGNHMHKKFDVYIKPWQENKIKEELGITGNPSMSRFELQKFLNDLNSSFPTSLSLKEKIVNLRRNWQEIRPSLPDKVVLDEDKTVLIGEKRVSNGKPREKTLRKLYIHTEGNPDDIARLIRYLKAANMTVAWTTEDSGRRSADIRDFINRVAE
ncbi:hypothetical protein C1752_03975 [Acaryochloris thomasi RCC1774]|uniref:Uncharacterized protein n=1 Tax=Acaryochloris thomasi RCC1774 TaxID=1764569 RepID=A0A2W1JU38_9CYAN|nr:hypothetical protein [Acaryochloris thomasi]PZD72097.1 hypothetical protein C1752_03975 [Acaryochloris thomasi RCC1774]